ncbi:MAG: hypothetical protein ACI3V2_07615 [Faecousia sp.]
MELQYEIAGLRIRFCSNAPLRDCPRWQLFAADISEPVDFTYDCRLLPKLPALAESDTVRLYFDSVKMKHYAITRECGGVMQIYLSEENLPWGTQVEQLYSQLALPHILLQRDRLLLHASYILTDRGAILFTAPSGVGKSTQASLWRLHRGAFIVNGDRAVLGLDGSVPMAYGFPVSGSSADCHNRSAAVRAVVSLRQAPTNTIRRLQGSDCVRVLINGTYLPPEYRADMLPAFHAALRLAERVPIFELSCLPEESAVECLETLLKRTESGE